MMLRLSDQEVNFGAHRGSEITIVLARESEILCANITPAATLSEFAKSRARNLPYAQAIYLAQLLTLYPQHKCGFSFCHPTS